jgi:hypothetical protein
MSGRFATGKNLRGRRLLGQSPFERSDQLAIIGLGTAADARHAIAIAIDEVFAEISPRRLTGAREVRLKADL